MAIVILAGFIQCYKVQNKFIFFLTNSLKKNRWNTWTDFALYMFFSNRIKYSSSTADLPNFFQIYKYMVLKLIEELVKMESHYTLTFFYLLLFGNDKKIPSETT